jgi:hypothetical protein
MPQYRLIVVNPFKNMLKMQQYIINIFTILQAGYLSIADFSPFVTGCHQKCFKSPTFAYGCLNEKPALTPIELARPEGFEPPTFGFEVQLSKEAKSL